MTDMIEAENRKGVALSFMKQASRDTFRVCAQSAEELAQKVESGELQIDAPTALRLLVYMFERSSGHL